MLNNIIIFFILLLIFLIILRHSTDYKEGFFDFPDNDHNTFVQNSKSKFNELTNTINLTDPALPITQDTSNAFKIALGGISTKPNSTTYNLGTKNNYFTPTNIPNNFQQAQSCETAGTTCDAFDDPAFAASCGMSFDNKSIGINGKPHIGGLYISPENRQTQTDAANNVLSTGGAPYDPYKIYQPTFGKAKPGTFSLTKDQCTVVKEKIDCAAKQTFNSPNCTQCYTSQNFARVGPETGKIPSILYLFGSGNVTVSSQNNIIMLPINDLDSTNPMTVAIPADAEGTVFSIVVQQPNNIPLPYVAGYIEGQTPRGTFKLDLFNLVESDQVSKVKPKLNGSITINGFRCLSMIPGSGQTYLNLACLMPFSFLSMYDGDALTCDNGPIITQAASATFLESDPCFGKANKPGDYKLECLQERWIELGGTQQGTGYPSNKTSADAIQRDVNGNPLDIDTIVNNLAPKMTSASTGQDANGKNLSIADWDTVSMFATGIPINTPCDGPTSTNGPLTKECLQYLYLNQGINSHIGSTYTLNASSMASMKGQNTANTYCQPGTSIDPSTPAGLKFAQSIGGINAVKQSYDQINRLANDNTQSNIKRSTAINQCYGVSLDVMASGNTTGPTQTFAVGPSYNYTKAQAQGICSQYGAQVATTAQLQDAQTKGADWCFTGWVSDSNTAMYPITTSIGSGCGNGNTGVINYNPPNNIAGVNCYGPKPGIDNYPAGTIMPFNQSSWDYNPNASTAPSAPSAPSPQGVFTVLGGPVSGGYNMWYSDTNLTKSNMNWTQKPGTLATIALAPNGTMWGTWGTGSTNAIYYSSDYKANTKWIGIPGSLRQISTDGVNVVGTNSNNQAFTATYGQAFLGQWVQLPSLLTKIVTYNGQYYCLGLNKQIFYLTSPSSQWIQTLSSGLFIDIAMDNGVVLLIGTDNVLYYADSQLYTPGGTVRQVPNQSVKFNAISLSNGSIYAIDVSGQPWYTSNYKSGNLIKVVGGGEFYPSHRVTTP